MNAIESKFFQLEQLSDGVYGAISSDAGFTVSNAGILDFGNFTLVWDAMASEFAAMDLRRAAQEITGKPVSILVNSHHHMDHSRGNQVFTDCQIISSRVTRDLMRERFERFRQETTNFPNWIEETHGKLALEVDPIKRKILESEMRELQSEREIVKTLKPTFPSITFEHELELHGSKRSAKILEFAGHTGSDSVLLIDNEILFAGDLLLEKHLGFIGHGNPEIWLETLNKLGGLSFKTLLPGHGKPSERRLIPDMKNYIREMLELGNNIKSKDELEQVEIPEQWREWGLLEGFKHNLEFLFKQSQS
jgi:glyoxylase-like metal-dependent hydrolase (beta-lactamase superfamily II)